MGVTVLGEGESRPRADAEYGLALAVVGLDGLGEGETFRWVSRLTSVDAEGSVVGRRPRGEVAREVVVEVEVEAPDQSLCGMEMWWREEDGARDEGLGFSRRGCCGGFGKGGFDFFVDAENVFAF